MSPWTRDLRSAVGLLTIMPVREADLGDRDAVGMYPWVGWLLGLVAVLSAFVARRYLGPATGPTIAPLAILGSWAVLTRALHWDGLADTADGLMGGRDRTRRLEIMRDSAVGAFGALAIVWTFVAEAVLLAVLVSRGLYWPLVAAPVLGRLSACMGAWTVRPARADGLGAAVSAPPSVRARVAAVAAVVVVTALPGAEATLAGGFCMECAIRATAILLLGVGAAVGTPRVFARGVGGVTGDILGASVMVVETVVLAAAALVA